MCVQVDEMHVYKYWQHDMTVWFNGDCIGGKTLIYIVITNSKNDLMATIKLKFRPSSVPETEGTLYYQVINKRKVKWISTGYHVYPCEWDEKTGEVLIPPNSERKAELEKMQSQINWELKQWDSIIVKMGNQHKNVTINELCDAFNKTKTQKTIFMFLQEQVAKKEQMKRQGTAMTYSNAYRRFKEFREGKDLTFDELTPDMMECYEACSKTEG